MKASVAQFTEAAPVRYRPRRVGHVNFFITDLDQSVAFYTKICGFEITALEPNIGAGFFSNGNTHHDIGVVEVKNYAELAKTRHGETSARGYVPGLNHFGWEMENEKELVDAHFRAIAAGIEPRVTDQGTSRSNYVFDMDLMLHQFYADQIKDWRTVFIGGPTKLHSNPPWTPGESDPSIDPRYDPSPEIRRVADAPLHPIRVTHGCIVTDDLAALRGFYEHTGGFDPVFTTPDGNLVYLRGAASHYDMILAQAGPGTTAGYHHTAFELAADDDLDAAASALVRHGVKIVERCDFPHKQSLYIVDPDGTKLEFFIRRGGGFDAVVEASGEARLFAA
ncbi:MAG: VOC family protein [Proteobacteria bacterium]|nr:VOC family protein [Pseudomonadota bacterium]